MDITPLLLSLLTSILLLPFFILLILLLKTLLILTIPFMQLHARAHFSWQPNSSFLPSHHHEKLGVVRFKAHLNEQVECVFCLCNIEEGEEIRELRCHHLFHKSCLDGWLEHPHARCPLCRASLVSLDSTKFKVEDMDDDQELGTSIVPFVAYVHNAWWVW
ncbi:Zinc finger RING/FYVE/PHD-type protein [Dioscorea alata]|uniref:Zinc finger RING/FYVE/PHD-type protein n=1 Tax=Dioscorea alata TaxID=55571 RepID=A0ACB7VSS9_DIOAL|nr:Zinc finger RING/FYVE/PHD-type protein [Dioscorea alata]